MSHDRKCTYLSGNVPVVYQFVFSMCTYMPILYVFILTFALPLICLHEINKIVLNWIWLNIFILQLCRISAKSPHKGISSYDIKHSKVPENVNICASNGATVLSSRKTVWCSGVVLIALWGYITWIDFLLDVNPSERAPLCFYWPFVPLPLLLQVKYWTRTCATTSVCSFRRARWTTSSNRSYGTTSTYAPSPVSTPYRTTYVTLIHYTQKHPQAQSKPGMYSMTYFQCTYAFIWSIFWEQWGRACVTQPEIQPTSSSVNVLPFY